MRESNYASLIQFSGVISSLLAVGYYSTPSDSLYGKIAYGFVILLVVGIVVKVLHVPGGNGMIIVGLAGIFGTFGVKWVREKKVL